MGCNNLADTATLQGARVAQDAQTALPSRVEAAETARAVKDAVSRVGDVAILKARAREASPGPADRAAYGDVAEAAMARVLVEQEGHYLLHQNTRPGEKGIDLVTFDPATETITVWEVKSSLVENSVDRAPRMGRTNDGRQMSTGWLDARLGAAGLDQAKAADIEARAVKIDLHSGRAQVWLVDPATGRRSEPGGSFDINDLLDLHA